MPLPITIEPGFQLRILRETDAPALFAATDQNRRHLREWLPWLDGIQTAEDTSKFISLTNKKLRDRTGLSLGIDFRGGLVGVIDLHEMDLINRSAKIGYWLAEMHQGQGIMTRSAEALIRYAFEEMALNRLEIRVAPENERSQGIPRRLGFLHEGRLAQAEWLYLRFVDHDLYGMTRARWKELETLEPDQASV